MHWLQAVLILLIGGSDLQMKNAYLEEHLETCILYFPSNVCYDYIVSMQSGASN
jgi:hypothetical protein